MNLPNKVQIDQAFSAIRQEAERRWNEFKAAPIPKISIGMATCGIASGALDTKNALEEVLAERKIEAQIRSVGC
jgi:NADH-quinone oxidoreductase subunit F